MQLRNSCVLWLELKISICNDAHWKRDIEVPWLEGGIVPNRVMCKLRGGKNLGTLGTGRAPGKPASMYGAGGGGKN